MLRVSFRNLLVRDALKVLHLELAMSSFLVCLFWVVLLECTTSSIVQSLNSPFFPPHLGAEPGRAKRESRLTCMRMLKTSQ